MLIAVGVAMLIGAVVSLWQEVNRYGLQKRDVLLATAHVFASASASAIERRDADAAFDAIRAIGRLPEITYVSVSDSEQRLISELGEAVRLAGDIEIEEGAEFSPWELLQSRSLLARVAVVSGGREVGSLTLISDTSDLQARLRDVVLIALAGAILAGGIGLAITLKLQRQITRPLVTLAQTMATVRLSHDYAASVPISSDDEVGLLASSFNAMIGEIRKRDSRLARHREQLEQEVAARTRDLVVAKEVAEDASVAKSEFLATMSHEIRTPMNGMLVMAELLAASELPERQRRYAEVIARSGQSLLAIINDILDFAKVESGKLELETIPVDLDDVVETATTLFGERARAQGIDLAAVIMPDCPRRVIGDPVRLTQVISNLINNALKFTRQGHVLIRVAQEEGARDKLRVSVEDTGIGIAPDKIETIFTAFSQADQSTTRKFGGTGLGLSICKRLVEAMKGEIRVDSIPGRGSCFSFTIPVGEPSAECQKPQRDVVQSDVPVIISVSGAATRQALSVLVPACGHRLIDAREAGAEAWQRGAPDAIWLIDANELKESGRRPPRSGTVAALAGIGDESGENAIESGLADTMIRLPIASSEVAGTLERLRRGESLSANIPRPDAMRGGTLPRFRPARVLVADDSPVNLEVACEALARLGITPDTAENGRQAYNATVLKKYEFILMDVSMPEMDGFQACQRIRKDEARRRAPRTPIIALTAHVVGTNAEAWRAAGMDGVLHKPFSIAELARVLGQYLHRIDGEPAPQEHDLDFPPREGLGTCRIGGHGASPPGHRLAGHAPISVEPPRADTGKAASGTGPEVICDALLPAAPATLVLPSSSDAANASDSDGGQEGPLLDMGTLTHLAEMAATGNAGFLGRILGLYLDHAPRGFEELSRVVAGRDMEAIAQAAHALKSMSVNIGAGRLAERLSEVERNARRDGIALTRAECESLRKLLDETIVALKALFDRSTIVPPPAPQRNPVLARRA